MNGKKHIICTGWTGQIREYETSTSVLGDGIDRFSIHLLGFYDCLWE
jgi:hypothetical protein